jgi:hypothetical protein
LLPYEYQGYLKGIRPYEPTTTRQRLGQFIFLATWAGPLALVFGPGRIFLGKDGRYPAWYRAFANSILVAVWASYDHFFKRIFGDGERCTGKAGEDAPDEEALEEGSRPGKYAYGALKVDEC